MKIKKRLDVLLTERMFADTRSKAQAIIMSGNVYVNGEALEEPYLKEKDMGDCDIEMPYQVPDGRWFVMGDARATSVDSRNKAIGCVSEEQIVGRLVFRIWPLDVISRLD